MFIWTKTEVTGGLTSSQWMGCSIQRAAQVGAPGPGPDCQVLPCAGTAAALLIPRRCGTVRGSHGKPPDVNSGTGRVMGGWTCRLQWRPHCREPEGYRAGTLRTGHVTVALLWGAGTHRAAASVAKACVWGSA